MAAAAPGSARDPRTDTSFAAYLARYLVAKKGYRPGTVPEAEPLAAASDYIVTKLEDVSFSIVCIVDATRDLKRQFALDRYSVTKIAAQCRARYAGRVSAAKMPVLVEIIEIRNRVTPEDLARLKPLRSRMRQIVAAHAVDILQKTSHSNFWALYDARGRMIEKLLKAPRLSSAELEPPPARVEPETTRKPLLTVAMLALLAAIFVLEVKFPADGGSDRVVPSLATLIAFGGLMRSLVEQGEWYRIFTAPLLHASPEHILFNGIAFWFAGRYLERLLGRAWLLALFFLGAIGGALMSMAINDPGIVSVGASGAIMCLIAAAFTVSFRSRSATRRGTQFLMLRMLIPSLLPLATHGGGGGVDYGAHFGGALVGFAASGLLLMRWPRSEPGPRLGPLAKALAALAVIVFGGAGYQASGGYQVYVQSQVLIPDSEIPDTDAEIFARSQDLLRKYPNDPRAHFFRAAAVMRSDPPTAERELRTALSERQGLALFNHDFEVTLVSYLARVLIAEGRPDEAHRTAEPYCNDGPDGRTPEDLAPLGLCPPP